MAREPRNAKAVIQMNGRLRGANIRNFGAYDTQTGENIDRNGARFIRVNRADMRTASSTLRNEQANRMSEINAQKSRPSTVNSRQSVNRANARAKERYDIKRALGVSVG